MYSVLKEPNCLHKLNKYDFVPKIISSFQDYEHFYLVTTFFEGQSLNFLKSDKLTEEQIKFVCACVIQSLLYLRKEKIIHRDIMMKNIVMDNDKYFNLIDFTYSIKYLEKGNNKHNMITYNRVTPPEMYYNNSEYDYNSDYYRLGSVIYYLIFKKYPYTIKKEKKINEVFTEYKGISNYSFSCIDFMNKLLIANYTKRIGFKDIKELIKHNWFKDFDWKKLEKRKIKSPFKFYKNELKKSSCSNHKLYIDRIRNFKKLSKLNIYQKLADKFEYVNKDIVNKILKNY